MLNVCMTGVCEVHRDSILRVLPNPNGCLCGIARKAQAYTHHLFNAVYQRPVQTGGWIGPCFRYLCLSIIRAGALENLHNASAARKCFTEAVTCAGRTELESIRDPRRERSCVSHDLRQKQHWCNVTVGGPWASRRACWVKR